MIPGYGHTVRALRLRLGWTQSQLALALHVSRRTVVRWETDATPLPQIVEEALLQLEIEPPSRIAVVTRKRPTPQPAPCACGCGALVHPHRKRGRQVIFVSGHNTRLRSKRMNFELESTDARRIS